MAPLHHQDTDILRQSQAICPVKRQTELMGVKRDRKIAAVVYTFGNRWSLLQGTSK